LHGLYGSKEIPAFLQSDIDVVFGGSGGLRPREITPGQISDQTQISSDIRRTADDLQRADILAGRTGDFLTLPDSGATNTADRLDLSFDQYIAEQVELLHDVSNLYAGIEYLRYLEGEKHLVFVTPVGITLPRFENDKTLAAVASDARVVLDIIYVAGAPVGPQPTVTRDGKISAPVLPTTASIFQQTATVNDMRATAEMTGGQLTAFRSAEYGFAHLDQATRFEYLLGYSPSSAATDGAFRKIEVKVKRPGAHLLYRQGYFATAERVPLDRRQFITFNRLSAAGRYQGQIEDIKVTLEPPALGGRGDSPEILVRGTIRSPRIRFSQADGIYRASLDIAVYAGSDKQETVGEVQRRVDLQLKEATYRAFAEQGASFDIRVPLRARPKYVKVIVYDYAADVLGSGTAAIR
jgi:VWFA-related protein